MFWKASPPQTLFKYVLSVLEMYFIFLVPSTHMDIFIWRCLVLTSLYSTSSLSLWCMCHSILEKIRGHLASFHHVGLWDQTQVKLISPLTQPYLGLTLALLTSGHVSQQSSSPFRFYNACCVCPSNSP